MSLSTNQIKEWLGRELGSLALTSITPIRPEIMLRVVAWSNGLARLGIMMPPFLPHDLGVAMAGMSGDVVVTPRQAIIDMLPSDARAAHQEYSEVIREVAETEVAERARAWRLSDDLVTVLLAKLVADIWTQWPERHKRPAVDELPLDAQVYEVLEPQLH